MHKTGQCSNLSTSRGQLPLMVQASRSPSRKLVGSSSVPWEVVLTVRVNAGSWASWRFPPSPDGGTIPILASVKPVSSLRGAFAALLHRQMGKISAVTTGTLGNGGRNKNSLMGTRWKNAQHPGPFLKILSSLTPKSYFPN